MLFFRIIFILPWQLLTVIDAAQSSQVSEQSFLSTRALDTVRGFDLERSLLSIREQKYLMQDAVLPRSLGIRLLISVKKGQDAGRLLAEVTWKILEPYVRGCRLFLLTQDSRSFLVFFAGRYTSASTIPLVLYDTSLLEKTSLGDPPLTWLGIQGTCQVFLLDMTNENTIQLSRFLQDSTLWLMPDAKIILLGRRKQVQTSLWMPGLRNSAHVVYVGFDDEDLMADDTVTVYSRCLFSSDYPGRVRVLASGHVRSGNLKIFNPFPCVVRNFQRLLLRATALPYFPYVDYQMNLKELSKQVLLRDSLDRRIVEALSSSFNFTYEVYTPRDLSFGMPSKNGTMTGMAGDLHRGIYDFGMTISTSAEKVHLMDHTRLCETDKVIIITLRPQLQPQYLAIISPFTAIVWICLVISFLITALSLWILEKLRSKFTGIQGTTLDRSLFYCWGMMLEDTPENPPPHTPGQILVGWWLIAAFVISTVFKSSLVANLSVPSKTKPINSYEDLIAQKNWHWGIYDLILTGQPRLYFMNDKDPVLKQIYQNSEPISIEAGLTKILGGRYAFITSKNRIRSYVDTMYTDRFGRSVMYFSKTGYKVVTDMGWAFRKGAPFYNLFVRAINGIIEGGLIEYWIEDVLATRIRQILKEKKESGNEVVMNDLDANYNFENDAIILRTWHLIGVYFVVLGGLTMASLTFLAEKLIEDYYKRH